MGWLSGMQRMYNLPYLTVLMELKAWLAMPTILDSAVLAAFSTALVCCLYRAAVHPVAMMTSASTGPRRHESANSTRTAAWQRWKMCRHTRQCFMHELPSLLGGYARHGQWLNMLLLWV